MINKNLHQPWGVDAVLADGGGVGADPRESLRAGQRPPGSGDVLLNLDHPEVAFGLVVIEGDREVDHVPLVFLGAVPQSLGQSSGLGAGPCAGTGVGGDATQCGVVVAVLESGEDFGGQGLAAFGQGVVDCVLRVEEHIDHGLCPGGVRAGVLGHGGEFAQDVGAAQGLVVAVDRVGGQGAGEGGRCAEVVHLFSAAQVRDAVEGDQVGAHHVQPVQPPGHPHSGLVRVRDRGRGQVFLDLGLEVFEVVVGAGQHGQDGAGGDRQAEQAGHGLGQPLGRQVLVSRQVGDRGPHTEPVHGLTGHQARSRRRGGVSTSAPGLVQPVLGHLGTDLRQIENLPGLKARTGRTGQFATASAALGRTVIDYVFWVGDLLQPATRVILRPARLAASSLPQRLRRRLLPQPVTGRRT